MSDYVMFAAVNINDPYRGPINVNWYANSVRRETGRDYNGDDPADGWQQALKHGWRVRRVTVTTP